MAKDSCEMPGKKELDDEIELLEQELRNVTMLGMKCGTECCGVNVKQWEAVAKWTEYLIGELSKSMFKMFGVDYDIVTAIDEKGTLFAFTNRDKTKIVPVFMFSVIPKNERIDKSFTSVTSYLFNVTYADIESGLDERDCSELTADDIVSVFPEISSAKKIIQFCSLTGQNDLDFFNGNGIYVVDSTTTQYSGGAVKALIAIIERDWVSHQFAFADLRNKITGVVAAFVSSNPPPRPVFQFVWTTTTDTTTKKITKITLGLRTADRKNKGTVLTVELGGSNSMFMRVFCNTRQLLIDRLTQHEKESAIGPLLYQVYSLNGSLDFIQGRGRINAPGLQDREYESDGITVLSNVIQGLWRVPTTMPAPSPPYS